MRNPLAVAALTCSALVLTACGAGGYLETATSVAPNAASATCAAATAAATRTVSAAFSAGSRDMVVSATNAAIDTALSTASSLQQSNPEWADRITQAAQKTKDALPGVVDTAGAAGEETLLLALAGLAEACEVPAAAS